MDWFGRGVARARTLRGPDTAVYATPYREYATQRSATGPVVTLP